MRGYTLHGRVNDYVMSIQYGLRGRRTLRIARIETGFVLLRDLRAAVVELRLAPRPRGYRYSRTAELIALDRWSVNLGSANKTTETIHESIRVDGNQKIIGLLQDRVRSIKRV